MKRWLVRICVFLVLGAIVNVAVAWGIGFFAARSSAWSSQHPMALVSRLAGIEGSLLFLPEHEMRILVWTGGFNWHPSFGASRRLPTWSTSYGTDPLSQFVADLQPGESLSSMEYAAGFPCFALRYCEITKHSKGQSLLLAERGHALHAPAWMFERRLWADFPCTPLWPGFAINTVFYAFILWLLFAGPFVLRRRRRIRRGLCPKCAYDLRGSVGTTACPECGAVVTPRRGDGV